MDGLLIGERVLCFSYLCVCLEGYIWLNERKRKRERGRDRERGEEKERERKRQLNRTIERMRERDKEKESQSSWPSEINVTMNELTNGTLIYSERIDDYKKRMNERMYDLINRTKKERY